MFDGSSACNHYRNRQEHDRYRNVADLNSWLQSWVRAAIRTTNDRRAGVSKQLRDADQRLLRPPADFLLDLEESVLASGSGEKDLYTDLGPAVVRAEAAIDPTSPVACLAHLAAANLLQIMGVDVDVASVERVAERLVELDTTRFEPHAYHWSKGVAALALDRPLVYRAVAALPEDGAPAYDPSVEPGFNDQGWLAQLACAVESDIPFDEAVLLWRLFLAVYGTLVDVGAIVDTDLAWVARIVRHRIGGYPIDSVADWLCEELGDFTGISAPQPT